MTTTCAWCLTPHTGTSLTADRKPVRVPSCGKHGKRGTFVPGQVTPGTLVHP